MNIGEANDTQQVLRALVALPQAQRPQQPAVWDAAERLAERSSKTLAAGLTRGAIHYERPK
jgi:hypothetical protein